MKYINCLKLILSVLPVGKKNARLLEWRRNETEIYGIIASKLISFIFFNMKREKLSAPEPCRRANGV